MGTTIHMKKILSTIAIAFALFLPASPAFATFGFYRTVTVDHARIGSTDLANYPVLVASTTYSFLATVANGGKVQNSSGFDIGFYSSSDCATGKLAWEVERYIPTTGDSVFWVSNSTISHTTDSVFYLCYGNTAITTDQSATTTVWTNVGNYAGVYHFPNGSSLSRVDSSANPVTLSNAVGTATAGVGQVDGAAVMGTGVRLDGANTGNKFNFPNTADVSTWFKGTVTDNGLMVGKWNGANTSYILGWGADILSAGGQVDCIYKVAGTSKFMASSGTYNDNNWHKADCVYDGTNVSIYVDGTVASTAATGVITQSGTAAVSIGNFGSDVSAGFNGSLDEIRFASTSPSVSWITGSYNNERLPDKAGGSTGFYTLGTETPISGVTPLGSKVILFARWIINNARVIF